jgi:hypothetical protein
VTDVTVARPTAPQRSFRSLLQPIAIVATALVLAAATYLVDEPTRVDKLSLVNRGTAGITVSVAPASGDGGRQLLGTVEADDRQEIDDLVDQGDQWTFSFSSADVDLGSVTVPRARLARSGWTYVIPASVLEQLGRTER